MPTVIFPIPTTAFPNQYSSLDQAATQSTIFFIPLLLISDNTDKDEAVDKPREFGIRLAAIKLQNNTEYKTLDRMDIEYSHYRALYWIEIIINYRLPLLHSLSTHNTDR